MQSADAWTLTLGGAEVIVAVVDFGIDTTHVEFQDNIIDNRSFSLPGCEPKPGRHGTHVAGIIAAPINGEGVVGVAPHVGLMGCEIFRVGVLNWDAAADAINYAVQNGARVINCSWAEDGGHPMITAALGQALQAAQTVGVLVCCAAGNDYGLNNDLSGKQYPASWGYDNIISCTATTSTDTLAGFSNIGPNSVHVGAPGGSIEGGYESAWTEGTTSDHYILSTWPTDEKPAPAEPYHILGGTSMAAPQVSGLAAYIWSIYPDLTYLEVKDIIMSTGDELPSLSGKTISGRRINVKNAVGETMSRILSAITFEAAPLSIPSTGGTVTFTISAPSFQFTRNLEIDFGDGEREEIQLPTADKEITVIHQYQNPNPGIVTATLQLIDNALNFSRTVDITVTP
ncbi:MAG: hypothetical protein E3J72_22285 [Planctomycetota bacterium]|nr:MAG: hypothetical protein E3J72_22285 [Planctomycetota bacterium]